MPSFVRTDRCDGCRGLERAACESVCPTDLMALDPAGAVTGYPLMAWNREPEQCWECYACVKACPRQAIEIRAAADLVPLGGRVQPLREAASITWTLQFRDGTTKRFQYPIRTVPAGVRDPYADQPAADLAELGKPGFFTTGAHGLHPADRARLVRN